MVKGFKFHKLAREDKVYNYIDTRFNQLSKSWFQFQNQWISSAYKPFQDYEKYLIFLYLVKKTISFFSENLITYDYDTYFKGKQFEIANFNIIEISKNLDISKETARRKILELVKENIIKRERKKLTVINIIDRNQFSYHRPEKSIKNVSKFLSDFFNIIEKEKLIEQKIDQKTLEKYFFTNYTYSWNLFLNMQIPILLNWKKVFGDLESWVIFGQCWISKDLGKKKNSENNKKYIDDVLKNSSNSGINAMSISEITGIPRATVVRKLKKLVKMNALYLDNKKLYHPNKYLKKNVYDTFDKNKILISEFSTKIYNAIISSNLS